METNDWKRVRFGGEEEFVARRDSRDGNALKKTRVIWQSATLCRVKKAASSLNNARLFRSQRFPSNRSLLAATLASKRRAIEPRRLLVSSLSPVSSGRNANGSNLGRAISSIGEGGEARTAQSMKNNPGSSRESLGDFEARSGGACALSNPSLRDGERRGKGKVSIEEI